MLTDADLARLTWLLLRETLSTWDLAPCRAVEEWRC